MIDTVSTMSGAAAVPFLPDLARLRIAVFREWPYLYDGDLAYEESYLRTYVQSPASVVVLVRAGDTVVGASTGVPLTDETAAVRRPFEDAGIDVASVFYFGESVLLPAYRGRGHGRRFFVEREAHARTLPGIELLSFCGVRRDPADPRRPAGHRELDAFWRRQGFERSTLEARFSWRELGETGESEKPMVFWTKSLARGLHAAEAEPRGR